MQKFRMKNFPDTNFLVVKYKFNYEEKVIIKMVTKDVFEELKNASTIEFCEIIN